METRFLRNAITLGLISAIGPFAIDMYLPALPDIGRNLHADVGAVQMSLTVFFIALSLGQSVYGPLSDMIGRKVPLYLGLGLFSIGSIGCALAPSIEVVPVRAWSSRGRSCGICIRAWTLHASCRS
jgi:DHA1 family bicyclomycin/chloramphenicol resistance-like MFS transporter